MSFSTGTGLERVGVARPDPDCSWAGMQASRSSGMKYVCCNTVLQALDVALFCKSKEEGGSARAVPVVAPMPKSISF